MEKDNHNVDLENLFWQNTLVSLRRGDKDISPVFINVRLIGEYAKGSEMLKNLRLYISNDSDSSFLYSLTVAEEHYGRIREDEKLLVDFHGFSNKLVWLLQQCHHKQQSNQDKNHHEEVDARHVSSDQQYKIILHIGGALAGTLKIVEANAFKELPHLTLQTRPGTDSSIKQFLEFRLEEVKAEYQHTSEQLAALEDSYVNLQQEAMQCREDSSKLSEKHKEYVIQRDTEMETLQKQLDMAQHLGRTITDQLVTATAAQSKAEERAAISESAAVELRQAKTELEAELAECMNRVQVSESRADVAEMSARQAMQRWEGFEVALQQADARVEEWRSLVTAQESRASQAISEAARLRTETEAVRQECHSLQQRITAKEREIMELQGKLTMWHSSQQNSEQVERDLKQRVCELENLLEKSRLEASGAQIKLDEAAKKMELSENMIQWLNKQLNAASLIKAKPLHFPPLPSSATITASADHHHIPHSKHSLFPSTNIPVAVDRQEWKPRMYCPRTTDLTQIHAIHSSSKHPLQIVEDHGKDVFDRIVPVKSASISPASVLN